jgi:hypothetical protein
VERKKSLILAALSDMANYRAFTALAANFPQAD